MMVSSKTVVHQGLISLKVQLKNLKGLLLKKANLQKMIIHLRPNQIFQHYDLIYNFPDKNH